MQINKVLYELYSYESKGWNFGLDNIKVLLKKIDNPEKNLRCIHVAGTNGKGSVCAFISSILKESGFKVGLYTSPHLIRFNERIQINGKEISDEDIAELYQEIRPYITNQTFFEITTAMAFLYFSREKTDFVVLETGLGGRLDATNVVIPLVSVITNVSLEHTDYLGDSIVQIAAEKAGIIKKEIPVVTSCKETSFEVIKKISLDKNAPLYRTLRLAGYKISLKGKFQRENAGIALKTVEILREKYKLNISNANIKNGFVNAKCPGRFEFFGNVVVDCAHNPDGIEKLIDEIKSIIYEKLVFLVGILRDKDTKRMMEMINEFADIIVLTKPNSKRAENPDVLKKFTDKKVFIEENIGKALSLARRVSSKDDKIIVCGSIYLAGEVLRILRSQ